MRVLLSTIGSRGDVQPVLALALRLREHGHTPRVCAPPDFGEWVEQHGVEFTPLGPDVGGTARPGTGQLLISPEQRRQMIEDTVAAQFATIPVAAEGCDVIVAATALQVAARSVAEHAGIGYTFTSYCPTALPSPHHPPPVLAMLGDRPAGAGVDHLALWAEDARRQDEIWAPALNAQRATLGLPPVDGVRGHILTDTPWLAADPALAPWPPGPGPQVFQTGAWLMPDDERPLPDDVVAFLDAGEPPVHFGFGSIRAPEGLGAAMVAAARALGRRAVLSRGWTGLAAADDGPDCLTVGDLDHRALFRRVAAVVHHGGAGTTTAAARAGAPQVVIPQHYDQHYFARRVAAMGVGAAHPPVAPSADSLAAALEPALRPGTAERAADLAGAIRTDGTEVAVAALAGTDRQPR